MHMDQQHEGYEGQKTTTTNNNNIQDNVYGVVIMAEPLREFIRFI